MIWQDIVLSIGNWIFIIALLPSVFSLHKPALATSLMTGTVLAVFAFTFLTLDLRASSLSTALTSITWFILSFQSFKQRKKIKSKK